MFTHKMDPLVRAEFDSIQQWIQRASQTIDSLTESFTAVEQKLDELLSRNGSITPEDPKAEPLALSPGYKPWSQRKRERIQKSHSSKFIDKVVKGAAATEPRAPEAAKE